MSSTSPSGTIATVPATAPDIASRQSSRSAELAEEEQRRGRHDRERHVREDRVDARAQLRAREREPAGVLGELHRVGLGADVRRPVPSGAGRDERPGQHLVARRLVDRVGLAGEQRLVDLEAAARSTSPSTTTSEPAPASSTSSSTTSPTATSRDLAVADDPGLRRRQHREPVERALGAQLLHDADAGVRDQHEAEQRVLERPDDEDDREHRAEQRVEPREDVRAHDLGDRPRRGGRDVVDLPAGDALGDLGRGQASCRVDVRRLGRGGRGHVRRA